MGGLQWVATAVVFETLASTLFGVQLVDSAITLIAFVIGIVAMSLGAYRWLVTHA